MRHSRDVGELGHAATTRPVRQDVRRLEGLDHDPKIAAYAHAAIADSVGITADALRRR